MATQQTLMKQFELHSAKFATKTTTTILEQKVKHLSFLCEHHKSKYEQLNAQFKINLSQQRDDYMVTIEQLQQQNMNQKHKLSLLQNRLQLLQHQSLERDLFHRKKLQTSSHEIDKLKTHVRKMRQNMAIKDLELDRLKRELSAKDVDFILLKRKLIAAYEQYIPSKGRATPSLVLIRSNSTTDSTSATPSNTPNRI
eukprot:407109_1